MWVATRHYGVNAKDVALGACWNLGDLSKPFPTERTSSRVNYLSLPSRGTNMETEMKTNDTVRDVTTTHGADKLESVMKSYALSRFPLQCRDNKSSIVKKIQSKGIELLIEEAPYKRSKARETSEGRNIPPLGQRGGIDDPVKRRLN